MYGAFLLIHLLDSHKKTRGNWNLILSQTYFENLQVTLAISSVCCGIPGLSFFMSQKVEQVYKSCLWE